jgi:hypothetical protein
LVTTLLGAGRGDEALAVLETGLPWHDDDPSYRLQPSQQLAMAGQSSSAQARFSQLIEDSEVAATVHAEAAYGLALIALHHGDVTEVYRAAGRDRPRR